MLNGASAPDGRTYAEDIATLLDHAKTTFWSIARRIESGDSSAIETAPERIRAEFSDLRRRFLRVSGWFYPEKETLRETDVGEVVRDVLAFFGRRCETAGIRVRGPDDTRRVRLRTFPGDLRTALFEVVLNAIDSLNLFASRSRSLEIEVNLARLEHGCEIYVRDNGAGFADEVLARLGPSTNAMSADQVRFGQGLYVATRAMQTVGGDLTFRNRPEGGAEVRLTVRDLP